MASHNQPGADILPFGQPTDAPGPRFVRPIPAEQIARIMGELVDLYKSLEQPRRGLLDRCADALSGDRFFFWFLGFACGLAVAAVFVAAFPPTTFR